MAFSIVQESTPGSITSGTALASSWPSTTTPGNLLVAQISFNTFPSNPTITPPSGWVLAERNDTASTVRPGTAHYHIYPDDHGSGRSGAESFTLGDDCDAVLTLFEVTGHVDGTNLLDRTVEARDDAGSSSVSTGATATLRGANSIAFGAINSRPNADAGPPFDATQSSPSGGFTEESQTETRNDTQGAHHGAYRKIITADTSAQTLGCSLVAGCFWSASLVVYSETNVDPPAPPDYPEFRAAGTGDASTGNPAPTHPTTEDGDLEILQVSVRDTSTTPTTPGDWTPWPEGPDNPGSTVRQFLYWRWADGTETGTETVTIGGAVLKMARIYSFMNIGGNPGEPRYESSDFESADPSNTMAHADVVSTEYDALAVALGFNADDGQDLQAMVGASGASWAVDATYESSVGDDGSLVLQTVPLPDPVTVTGGDDGPLPNSVAWGYRSFALLGDEPPPEKYTFYFSRRVRVGRR